MARPTVSAATDRGYGRLPGVYRDVDEPLDFPLLRFLSLLGDQAGEVETLLDRIDYLIPAEGGTPGDTSDLADPAAADATWLPWLAQLVGIRLPANVQGQAARDAIAGAVAGFRAGTKGAIAAAVKSRLSGDKFVEVYDHSTDASGGIGTGTQWDVLIVTRPAETTYGPDLITAAIDAGAKPAGVVLHQRTYVATWAQVETAYPTRGDLNGRTLAEISLTGMP